MKIKNKKRFTISIIITIILIIAIIGIVLFLNNKNKTVSTSEVALNDENRLEINEVYDENAISANTILNKNTETNSSSTTNAVNKTTTNTTNTTSSASSTSTPTSASTTSKTSIATNGLPVLMYHFFYDASAGEKGADNNWMEISAFEEQMKYLSDNNFYFPSWSEVEAYIDGTGTLPEKSVVVTIDDGDITFINLAIPIIEKYNVKATSFVVTSWNGDWLPQTYKSSHLDFQSHSHDMHRAGANGKGRLVNLSYSEALEDVTKSKELIGDCTVFCYPFGHYNDTAKKVLKNAGYKLAFTTEGGRVKPGQDKYALPRVRMSKDVSLSSFQSMVK